MIQLLRSAQKVFYANTVLSLQNKECAYCQGRNHGCANALESSGDLGTLPSPGTEFLGILTVAMCLLSASVSPSARHYRGVASSTATSCLRSPLDGRSRALLFLAAWNCFSSCFSSILNAVTYRIYELQEDQKIKKKTWKKSY